MAGNWEVPVAAALTTWVAVASMESIVVLGVTTAADSFAAVFEPRASWDSSHELVGAAVVQVEWEENFHNQIR